METVTTQDEPKEIVIPVDDLAGYIETAGLVPLAVLASAFIYKWFIQPNQEKLSLKLQRSMREEQLISGQLNQLLGITGAHRAVLLQPHNGEHFVAGGGLYKLSATHEEIDPGFTYVRHRIQSVPIGLFYDFINADIQSPQFFNTQGLKCLRDYARTLLATIGVKSLISYPLLDSDGVIGLIMLQYVGVEVDTDEYHKLLDKIIPVVSTISGLLQTSKKPWWKNLPFKKS